MSFDWWRRGSSNGSASDSTRFCNYDLRATPPAALSAATSPHRSGLSFNRSNEIAVLQDSPSNPSDVRSDSLSDHRYNSRMVRHVDAIFSQGAFRPLEPLMLPEGTRVHLS